MRCGGRGEQAGQAGQAGGHDVRTTPADACRGREAAGGWTQLRLAVLGALADVGLIGSPARDAAPAANFAGTSAAPASGSGAAPTTSPVATAPSTSATGGGAAATPEPAAGTEFRGRLRELVGGLFDLLRREVMSRPGPAAPGGPADAVTPADPSAAASAEGTAASPAVAGALAGAVQVEFALRIQFSAATGGAHRVQGTAEGRAPATATGATDGSSAPATGAADAAGASRVHGRHGHHGHRHHGHHHVGGAHGGGLLRALDRLIGRLGVEDVNGAGSGDGSGVGSVSGSDPLAALRQDFERLRAVVHGEGGASAAATPESPSLRDVLVALRNRLAAASTYGPDGAAPVAGSTATTAVAAPAPGPQTGSAAANGGVTDTAGAAAGFPGDAGAVGQRAAPSTRASDPFRSPVLAWSVSLNLTGTFVQVAA